MNAIEALSIVLNRVQWMRAEGESDLRSIIYLINGLILDVKEGKSLEDVMAEFDDGEEE
jgi:hypothetical protein